MQFALNRGTKSADLAQSPGFDGPTKVIKGTHFKLVIKQLDTLRSEAGTRRHFGILGWQALFLTKRRAIKRVAQMHGGIGSIRFRSTLTASKPAQRGQQILMPVFRHASS